VAAATGLWGSPEALVLSLLAAAALAGGAWTLREGLRAHAAFDARPAARRPLLPRKALSALLAGAGTALAALAGGTDATGALLYGLAALLLHVAAFGLDPLRDKFADGVDPFQRDRVARVVTEAEGYLADMRARVAALRDRALDERVATFEALARRMIRELEDDPRDLSGARKYLGVYLLGARDASQKFADLYARTRDAGARASYEALLGDLQGEFATRTTAMLEGGRADMDLEIKVLRDRLRREGRGPPTEEERRCPTPSGRPPRPRSPRSRRSRPWSCPSPRATWSPLAEATPEVSDAIRARMEEIDLGSTGSVVAFGSKAQGELQAISQAMLSGVRNKDLGPRGRQLALHGGGHPRLLRSPRSTAGASARCGRG
jgi:hypothetical protein